MTYVFIFILFAYSADNPDINIIPTDLTVLSISEGKPAPGKRVRQVVAEYSREAGNQRLAFNSRCERVIFKRKERRERRVKILIISAELCELRV